VRRCFLLLFLMTPGAGLAQEVDAVRAQLTAQRSATLSAGVSGVLLRFPAKEGEEIAANAIIAVVDCSSQAAQRRVAEARLGGARSKLRVNERLAELNSVGQLEVDLARAEAAMATAEIAAIDVTLRKCEARAPFAGVVVARLANQHQFVKEGEPLLELVDQSSLEVELVAPARWLKWLRPGVPFDLHVEDLDVTAPGKVVRLGGRVDPIAQTVRVIGVLDSAPRGLLPGMSGVTRFR